MIRDDLINKTIANYPSQLRQVEEFYSESLNCLDPGAEDITCGTTWRHGDFYCKLLNGELHGNEGKVEVLKLGVTFTNERGEEELIWPQRSYVDLKGRTVQAGYTWAKIDGAKKNEGRLFSALYYNEPVMDADRQFDVTKVKTFKQLPFELGPIGSVGVEAESQGNALISAIRKAMREENRRFRFEQLTSKRVTKHDRIRSMLQPLIADFNFNIREDLWRADNNLGEEIRVFDKGDDDALDACCYCAKLAKDPPEGTAPLVVITMDPAFTIETYSDSTSIVAGCYFQKEFWVLDCVKFKTDRTDVIIRMLFKMVDKFGSPYSRKVDRYSMNLTSLVHSKHPRFGKKRRS
jgi:hypothetical protein